MEEDLICKGKGRVRLELCRGKATVETMEVLSCVRSLTTCDFLEAKSPSPLCLCRTSGDRYFLQRTERQRERLTTGDLSSTYGQIQLVHLKT